MCPDLCGDPIKISLFPKISEFDSNYDATVAEQRGENNLYMCY